VVVLASWTTSGVRGAPLRVTVVVPTYNEAENLPLLVDSILRLPLDIAVHIVDDASPDGTGEHAERLAATNSGRVSVTRRSGKLGLRSAYLEGFKVALASGADAIGQMDADLSHEPARLVAMTKALASADLVLGSRYVEGGSVDPAWPFWRKGLSAWGNFYSRTILGLRIRDMTTGYRLWRRSALEAIPFDRVRSNGYAFLVEMAYLAHLGGVRIAEVPIHFNDRRFGTSKMSLEIQLEAAVRVWQLSRFHRGYARQSVSRC
jgi:dolichol-phosphate mannosyltransferase